MCALSVRLAIVLGSLSLPVLATEQCGGDNNDNPPCPPVFPQCAGAFCDDSVFDGVNPDPSERAVKEPDDGDLTKQMWLTREANSGVNGGACTTSDNYSVPASFTGFNTIKYKAPEIYDNVSFVTAPSPFGGTINTGKITGLPVGAYRVDYCLIFNNGWDPGPVRSVKPFVRTVVDGVNFDYLGSSQYIEDGRFNNRVCDSALVRISSPTDQVGVTYYKGGNNDGDTTRCRGAAISMPNENEVYDHMYLYQVSKDPQYYALP